MTLAQNNEKSNKEPAGFYNELALVANLIPGWCYHKILTPKNRPDLVAIAVLSELLSLYCATKETEFKNSYDYFGLKFNLSRSKVEAATLRLHNLGLVTRLITFPQAPERKRGKSREELQLKLNLERILSIGAEAAEEIKDEEDDRQELYSEEEDAYFYPEAFLRLAMPSLKTSKESEVGE